MSQMNKTQTTIQCNVENTPAILERLLRTIRVRGFALENLAMKTNDQNLDIELNVCGERNITMLVNQLNKLVDVNHIYLADDAANERMSA
ncbi:acetolactate synthase 2 small subunit [Alkalimarinus sediminis]|uniref:Acetolactate synthase 2 small subunit n=1 Tax=Alkalimarinus sediminis TaxID=1632866 RepID=A0A9E8KQE4_9ALTE|nr:acetolactate synthase 2 small subunit [Alkalimarinus sediminis]UZW75110.1 acetolactate synthase 2 small subunit [Alkalimarinus sediminis]